MSKGGAAMSGRLIERLSSRLKRIAKTIAAQVKTYFNKYKKQLIGVSGFTLYFYYSWIIDDPVWWYVLNEYGYLWGNLIMSVLGLPHNLFWLWIFTRSGFDWLGAYLMDWLREEAGNSNAATLWEGMSHWWTKIVILSLTAFLTPLKLPALLLTILLGKGDKVAFWALSILMDSFVTTVYLRHGNFEPLKKRDYQIFFYSTLIGVVYWSFRNSFVIALARVIWDYLFTT
ncbi:MAG: hypothetical protein V1690_00255 [Candidatus Moraniibacteriota bacterium]